MAPDYRPLVCSVKRTGEDTKRNLVPVCVTVGGEPRRVTLVSPVAPYQSTPLSDSSRTRSRSLGSSLVTVAVRSHGFLACKRGAFASGVAGLLALDVHTLSSYRRFLGVRRVKGIPPAWHPDITPSRSSRTDHRDGFTEADHLCGGRWRTPPVARVGARSLPRYAGLWHTAQESSKGKPAHPSLVLWGKQSRGAPEGLAHHTGSLRKVSAKHLFRTA